MDIVCVSSCFCSLEFSGLVVSTSASDSLERLLDEMIYDMSMGCRISGTGVSAGFCQNHRRECDTSHIPQSC